MTLLKTVTPGYPAYALSQGLQGSVTLVAVVDPEGKVANVRAVSGQPVFIPSTLAAVRQWVYRPALVDGVPAHSATVIRVNYFMN